MSCKECTQYYEQWGNGIDEMEATIEGLRKEISELLEMKNALNQLNALLKKELRELLGDHPF
ncbi:MULTISPECIES: hypothetical protein [Heyndrickxia]|uniref:hypothetical protein n=1 Tax=Heyndrickxia TaxID=2837504 RepID=UPI000557D9CC|nr:hypothetical protein [Heyndrickxia coagulans]AJH77212.1 hypothetical protein BF29_2716 [Heyndrickxia coagulans DSM 1 = ATCC 7050]AJH77327.1 hypothetical protein BF29_2225 [Heyndrickxia coagulans DSM 1 = ATCC 7050]AJH78124.1 hypothetical protein BF29_2976 [Heyndrickxia coagulans DSM 1 = ATCC 7050]AJH79146.1 hypothetical protein BF29_1797 [Heyndrickxia coagulans DSM 1 = ATCC 7050]AJH79341.1 hypothetical protein BF29_3187 [Heyndrickxia coagulans DSM 1 = ATCC 7050]